jgi:hypothetical protein
MGFKIETTETSLEAGVDMHVTRDVSIRSSNEFRTRWLAADGAFKVNVGKVKRELKFTALVLDFTTINALNAELVAGRDWTITITDQDTLAMNLDGGTLTAWLKSLDYKFNGVEYDVEFTFDLTKG